MLKKKYSLETNFEDYFKLIGKPFQDILNELGIKKNKKIEIDFQEKSKLHIGHISFYNNVYEALLLLRESNKYKTGIVTSKDSLRTKIITSKLPQFDIVSCPVNNMKGKPEPDQILFAMSQTSCSNEETIYIGDMEVDKIAAEKAKIDFLYAEWGYGSMQSANSIKNISEFMELLT